MTFLKNVEFNKWLKIIKQSIQKGKYFRYMYV